jgi:hypothetical protein
MSLSTECAENTVRSSKKFIRFARVERRKQHTARNSATVRMKRRWPPLQIINMN